MSDSASDSPGPGASLRLYARLAAAIAMAAGLTALVGWALDAAWLKGLVPGQVPMKANAAAAFLLSGIALASLLAAGPRRRYETIVRACAGAVAGLGLLTLVEYVGGLDFGLDQLLFHDVGSGPLPFPGRMAPAAALSFLLLGIAFLLLSTRRPSQRIAQALALAALVLPVTAIVGYGCRAESLYLGWKTTAMPLPAAVTFVLLSTGVLAATGGTGFMAVVASRTAGGSMLRRLWLPSVGILLVLGWLKMQGERSGLYGAEVGVSMMLVAFMILLTILIWRAASRLDQLDAERESALVQTRDMNRTLEQRVRERTASLTEINDQLESFTHSVSHDLRAPLRAMHGFSEILSGKHSDALSPDARACVDRIRASAGQMNQLFDGLLALSRLGRHALALRNVDMAILVRECLETLGNEHPGREIRLLVGDLPPCRGDPTLLKQVWANLLENAFKYTSKRPSALIEIGAYSADGGTVYQVRDNGVGFDMRYADGLFKVFQRLHPARDFAGTGVGLAVVQRIVRLHGGRVWAESAPEAGATFRFTLSGVTGHAA